jgi:cyclophilin family peptidyl-prolyl cis-trans isomerase
MKRLYLFFGVWFLLVVFRAGAVTPTILSPPESVTVNNASAAAFTVVATNAASYQWQFPGTNNLPAATNATLSLDNVTSNQAGSYTVVVTSSDSNSISATAVLTIVPGTIVQLTISTYPDGSSNSFLVQLFDHDKPATVENFIHYISSGAYSNMFFDRDVTNFVLQGGDYVTTDRTSNYLYGGPVSAGEPSFPSQVDSELNVGPLIHNTFGTLAMALATGKPDSASSAFFISLTNNSPYLDTNNGGFTVFGRVISNANVLQYFNTLSAPSNGILDYSSSIPTLPVNYDGTNTPNNANLFYCDFAFQTTPPVDTNPPTVSIAFPAPNAAFTNGSPLTVQGTAQDNVGLAEVFCVLTSSTGAYGGKSQTNAALGTTNWSLDLVSQLGTIEPGVYQLTAYAQDGAGNLSAPATEYFTNLAQLTIITNVEGNLTTNAPQYLVPGQQYSVAAAPGPGQQFDTWQYQGVVSINPVQTLTVESNLTLTVTYLSNTLPAGLAITNPAAGSQVPRTNTGLTVSGTLPPSDIVTQLTCQLFSQSNAVTAAKSPKLNGTNWTLAVSNLVGGPYTIVVVAEDSSGRFGLVSENFTLLAPPIIISQPSSPTVNNGSAADFTVVATNPVAYQRPCAGTNNLPGATNATLALDDVSTNQEGSYTVVITAPDGETLSSQPAVLTVVQGTIVQLTISTYPDGSSNSFLVELFDHDKPATVENFVHYINSGAYSNMFFDRDVTNFVLQGGDYVTTDRTNNHLSGGPVSAGEPNFPSQVDSELNVGPLIHNTFGTLAMALVSGKPDSASSAFFISLTNNSPYLDTNNGGFTVFGRVISNANALQYFNTLSAPSNGIFNYSSGIPTLPVNYDGTGLPANSNVFYCDFVFQTTPVVDTNPPTVVMTYPAPNAVFSNGSPLTVQGTAQDNIGLAEVFCILTSSTGAYNNKSQTNAALGTTNWSLNLVSKLGTIQPGVYQLTAYAQDGAGNLSTPATEYFTNLTRLTIITNVEGNRTTNAPQYLVPGQQYSVTAAPGPGQEFDTWTSNGVASLNPEQTFTANGNLTLMVTYLSNTLPAGLAISSPAAGSQVPRTNTGLTISGTLPSSTTVTQLTCQLFSQSNAVTAAQSASLSGATNWSLAVSNLVGGPYTIVVVAEDSSGRFGLVSEDFTLLAPPVIISQPASLTANSGSGAAFTVVATNAVAYQWQFPGTNNLPGATNATLTLDDVSTNQAGSYVVVITAPDGETLSSQPAVLTVVQGTIVQLTISTYPDGSSSNLVVELFDNDKPATVENFIHCIKYGAYSNMFFDLDKAGFILQGGTDGAVDRTNSTPGLTGWGIYSQYIAGNTNFPSQVDSEFKVGPLLHNTFGTLAMSLTTGKPDSASSSFLINLADNSANLDYQNGGFTVFGRVISNANVLQYFNTLSAPSNGISSNVITGFAALPVNYDGTNEPANSNLFFCDFKFLTPPPVDTSPPTVAIAFPAPNAVFTNGSPLTVQGTAHDDVGLAEVFCVLTSSTGAYGNKSLTNAALGTTNWSLNPASQLGTIEPGVYQLTAYAQDGAGNLSAPAAIQFFTNLTRLTIITNVAGHLTTNAPQYLVPGQQYSVTAAPGAGQQFYSWTSNGVTSINPEQTFTANGNLTLTVTYLSNNLAAGVTITNPVTGTQAFAIQSLLTVSGTLFSSSTVTQLTCQFFVNSNSISTAQPVNLAGTNWSLAVTNLGNGAYTVVAVASDTAGDTFFAAANFTLLNVEQLTLNVVGGGTIASNPGPYVVPGTYTVKAVPNAGQVFYSWSDGVTTTLNPSKKFTVVSNLTLTATFAGEDKSLKGIAFTYPSANANVPSNTFNRVEVKAPASLSVTQMTCQFFLQSNGVTASPQFLNFDAATKKWTLPVTNFTPGPYVVMAVAYDKEGKSRLVSEKFNLLAKLAVGVQGKGTVTAGLNGKYLQVGKSYRISATPTAGEVFAFWTGAVANSNSPATTFVMSSNTVLTATFTNNPFPSVAGTYNGLFFNATNPSPTSSGFVTLTVARSGVFSGKLVMPTLTLPIYPSKFPYAGSVEFRATKASDDLDLIFEIDLTGGTDQLIGEVSHRGAWTNLLIAYRAATNLSSSNMPAPGKYVLTLQPTNGSAGSPTSPGYAAVTVEKSGTVVLGGVLPDNTGISKSVGMSKEGLWPLFIAPAGYKGRGLIIGWQTNLSSLGQLAWIKPAAGGTYYPRGFTTRLDVTGAGHVPPEAGTNYEIVFGGGSLGTNAAVTDLLTVNNSKQFVPEGATNKLEISLLPGGALTGHFLNEVDGRTLSFKGAFTSPSQGGSGFTLDTNGESGYFNLSLKP